MDRFIFICGAAVSMLLGFWMFVRPKEVALKNRDNDDERPLTTKEIWTMRIVGVVLLLAGAYALWSLLTRRPGAEFFPV